MGKNNNQEWPDPPPFRDMTPSEKRWFDREVARGIAALANMLAEYSRRNPQTPPAPDPVTQIKCIKHLRADCKDCPRDDGSVPA